MKTLFLVSVIFMSQCVMGYEKKEYDSDGAIDLAYKFINKLRADTPFLYEDEVAFFGEKTLYSYVILHKLGYVDEKGQWIKPKPRYSYLCELIRLNSGLILLKNPARQYYFSGISKDVARIPQEASSEGLYDDLFYSNIAFIQEQNSSPSDLVGYAKSVIIGFRIPQKRLNLPIFVDGKPLLEYLGFTPDSKGVPELGKNELDKLVKHISNMDK